MMLFLVIAVFFVAFLHVLLCFVSAIEATAAEQASGGLGGSKQAD